MLLDNHVCLFHWLLIYFQIISSLDLIGWSEIEPSDWRIDCWPFDWSALWLQVKYRYEYIYNVFFGQKWSFLRNEHHEWLVLTSSDL